MDWSRVEANLAAANKSDMDTVIRLPETTLGSTDAILNATAGAPTLAPGLPSATPNATATTAVQGAGIPAAQGPSRAATPGTVTAASATAVKASSLKSQVTPSGGGAAAMEGDVYP